MPDIGKSHLWHGWCSLTGEPSLTLGNVSVASTGLMGLSASGAVDRTSAPTATLALPRTTDAQARQIAALSPCRPL